MSEVWANFIIYGGMAAIVCMTVFFRLVMEMEMHQNRARLPTLAQLCATSYATIAIIAVSSFADPTFSAILKSSFAGEWIGIIFGMLAFQSMVLLFGGIPFLIDTVKQKLSRSNNDREPSRGRIRIPMTGIWMDDFKFATVTSCLMVFLAASAMVGMTLIMTWNGNSLDETTTVSSALGISIVLPLMFFFRFYIAKNST